MVTHSRVNFTKKLASSRSETLYIERRFSFAKYVLLVGKLRLVSEKKKSKKIVIFLKFRMERTSLPE
jgi:hypothetical protein